jgi:hypothetical protein
MNTIIKQALQDALAGFYTSLQLDQRVKLEVGQHHDAFYAKLYYNNQSVHDYDIDGQVYDQYLYDNDTHIDSLVDVLLQDLKKATR